MPRSFTFRLTSEGVDQLKAQLEALGPAGDKAFPAIVQSSPQLKNALVAAQSQVDKTRASLEQLGTAPVPRLAQLEQSLGSLNRVLGVFGVTLSVERLASFTTEAVKTAAGIEDMAAFKITSLR